MINFMDETSKRIDDEANEGRGLPRDGMIGDAMHYDHKAAEWKLGPGLAIEPKDYRDEYQGWGGTIKPENYSEVADRRKKKRALFRKLMLAVSLDFDEERALIAAEIAALSKPELQVALDTQLREIVLESVRAARGVVPKSQTTICDEHKKYFEDGYQAGKHDALEEAEGRVFDYMKDSFSTATVNGVIAAIWGR